MNKIAAVLTDINQAYDIKDYVDAYLLPLKDLSINYTNFFDIEDVVKLKELNKEIFIILNKNIQNDEIDKLKQALEQIEKLNINGIIFYDISLVNLKNKLNLKTPLVWSQEHLVTNYGTVNYWNKKGVKYAYISSELTKREIEQIWKNTSSKLFVNVFGYIPMFTSKRHLVDNYVETFNLKNNKQNTIFKEGKSYHILDTILGTTVYCDYILNAVCEDFENIDYLVFNSNLIDEKDFCEVLENYNKNVHNKFKIETGFLYQETIYKVK